MPRFFSLAVLFIVFACGCIPRKTVPTGIYPKEFPKVPPPDAAAARVPPGYRVEVFMKDLIWPTSIDFDDAGNAYVAEAGYAYGDPFAPARILKISASGQITRFAEQLNAPITDLLWHNGQLYVSHRGKISVLSREGALKDLVTGLPSYGDHHNNQLAAGPDGKIYFGQGSASNAGVIGLDNVFPFVWLTQWPDVHDVPAKDLRLRSTSYLTPQPNNVLSRQGKLIRLGTNVGYAVASIFARNPEKSLLVRTRGFQPFGHRSRFVKGDVKANGTILRMNPDGTGLEVYAWGLRNPFGVLWGPDGNLYAADNAYDERGSRPIANAKDNIWRIRQGAWYGFPDYSSGIPVTDPQFRPARGPRPRFLMKDHPPVEQPWMMRPEHAGITKFDFSTSNTFGYRGHMFLTEVGSVTPITSDDKDKTGYVVVRIDPETRNSEPFLRNGAPGPTGLEYVSTPGPRRPVDARFSPDGNTLFIVDIGVIHGDVAGAGPFPLPIPGTGVIWRISKEGSTAYGPSGNLSPQPPRANR